jgi:cell division protein FtsA
LRGREQKEISLKNLSKIIHARVVEIVEQVFSEIKAYGHEDPRRKLIAGIVLTGGGANLKHIKQLVEYITGMDTRIGYPNEHLAGNSDEEFSSPLYATAVGLVMNSIENKTQSAVKLETTTVPEKVTFKQDRVFEPFNIPNVTEPPTFEKVEENSQEVKEEVEEVVFKSESTENKIRRSFFDKYVDKIKEFLDNAE